MSVKVLIVDDELLVRIGIKSSIVWEKYGMEVVGEASDGLEALQKIKLLCPDLILLDIKMPNMNGIELMHKIKESKINCKVLILSGFDDLYHVKEAMKLGAVDYLHKPCMNSTDILDVLINMKQQIEDEKLHENNMKSAFTNSEKSKRVVKEIFLKELLDGVTIRDAQFNQKCQENNVKLENGNFICLAFSVKDLVEVQKRYNNSNISMLQSSICNFMNEVLLAEKGTEFVLYDNNIYVTIISSQDLVSEKRMMERVNSIVYITQDALKQFLNVNIVVGVSNIRRTPAEIKNAFGEALKALKQRFFLREAYVIYYNALEYAGSSDSLQHIGIVIEKLKACLTKKDYHEFQGVLEELVKYLEVKPCLSEEDVKKLFNAFLLLVKEGRECFKEMEYINECETLQQLMEVWKGIFKERLLDGQGNLRYQNCSYLVKKIIDYIEDNYNQEITLELLSANFNLSPGYISRLFKEDTGEALFNYINVLRIEKAKQLLNDHTLKIYEVGYRVGFKSSVHFNIVFGKFAGMTPKQYRDSL